LQIFMGSIAIVTGSGGEFVKNLIGIFGLVILEIYLIFLFFMLNSTYIDILANFIIYGLLSNFNNNHIIYGK